MHPVLVRSALAAVLALPFANHPAVSPRCSLTPGFHPKLEGDGDVLLVMPREDTAAAGPGLMEVGQGPGHAGNGVRSAIHGQVFELLGHARTAPEQPAASAVVLVPWDYDASCQPVPWSRSALWMRSTDTLLVSVTRRDRWHWAGVIPTYDVTALPQSIYSGRWSEAIGWRAGPIDSTTPVNSPRELLEVLRRLPSSSDVLRGDEVALDGLHEWALAHPIIAGRRPASTMVTAVRQRTRVAQLMAGPVPFRGTWQLEIQGRNGLALTRWLRTESVPFVPKGYGEEGPFGFEVLYNVASSAAALPDTFRYGKNWGITVWSRHPGTERHWRFTMPIEEFEGTDPRLDSLLAERSRQWKDRWREGVEEPVTGEIALTGEAGARLRITWDVDHDGRPDITIDGVRTSSATLAEPMSARQFQRW